MKIYTISGLGADQRVFDFLTLHHEVVPVEWIKPLKGESIVDYSKRISNIIDSSEEFCLIGVSFGGLIATEINKILPSKLALLISSAETRKELPLFYRSLGKLHPTAFLPQFLFQIPSFLSQWLFRTQQKTLLNNILQDSDPYFVKWAVGELLRWKNTTRKENVFKIHGTADKMIPLKIPKKVSLVKGGAHFMIVDRAEEISEWVNDKIKG